MTGYQEVVTDPSFAEQLVCFTAPMVGNYGVADGRSESARPHARAVLMREARGPGLDGLAARARHRRAHRHRHALARPASCATRGAMRAVAVAGDGSDDEAVARRARAAVDGGPRARRRRLDRASRTSTRDAGRARVAVVDYGCKRSILRRLAGAGRRRHRLPARRRRRTSSPRFDGVAALERPGRSRAARGRGRRSCASCSAACRCSASASATSCSRSRPGTRRYKLPFGHRGANHPVLERATGRVLVTSQNHGFAVAPSEAREATHVSLYDGTVEGLDFPRAPRALGAVPSGGRAGPARRLADHRTLGRGGGVCRGGTDLESICLIGSGPIVIGQACEFDYAGCQALKVLREDGFRTIVVNSNPATIMTDPGLRRPHVPRAARPRGRRRRARARAAGRAAADDGRPDGAQPRARARARPACSTSSGSS